MLYTWKVRLLKRPRGSLLWRYWRAWRGDDVGNYSRLPDYVRRFAPGHTFADIGCMWGVDGGFEPDTGYGNWFWGLTPSCVASMLETAGFRVDERATEPFAQTFVCTAVAAPFAHRLPDEREAREMGREVSAAGNARPA
jgi:hypothetical protein